MTEEKKVTLKLVTIPNPNLPTLHIDRMTISGAPDNQVILQWYCAVPPYDSETIEFHEHARTALSLDHTRKMLEVITAYIDYYPERPKAGLAADLAESEDVSPQESKAD